MVAFLAYFCFSWRWMGNPFLWIPHSFWISFFILFVLGIWALESTTFLFAQIGETERMAIFDIRVNEVFVRQVRFCGLLIAYSSLFLRSLFALPSLQGRDDNIGFRDICVKQTCVYAACRAGFTCGGGTDFVRGWRKPDASMERGWCSLGTAKVQRWFLSCINKISPFLSKFVA